MKVTVCQIGNSHQEIENDWNQLIDHVKTKRSELLLLPEMTFSPWFCASDQPKEDVWQSAVESHEQWLTRLGEAGVPFVAGTRPKTIAGKMINEAFTWTPARGATAAHQKYYLPDEEGFWEATWYERGDGDFSVASSGDITAGFLICSEMWFMHRARTYGKEGARIILVPRSTPEYSGDKWLAGGRVCAVVSGAYCLSSNRCGQAEDTAMAGLGWVIDPDGNVLATTSDDQPFATVEIDLAVSDQARKTYPRYVPD